MRPIKALLLKELRQHRWSFLALTGALALALGVQVWSAGRAARVLSLLDYARSFSQFFIPLAGIVLGNRLVVQEYQGRTHVFLEGLPIPRVAMVVTKYALGLVYLVSANAVGLMVMALLASHSEPIGGLFLTILMLKSSSFVFFAWAVLFAMGFAGRFRIPTYIGIFFILTYLDSNTAFDIAAYGPLALLRADTFSFERQEFAWDLLIQTNLMALAFTALAFLLALIRDGAVVEALSRKMTQREKATVGTIALAAVVAVAALDNKKTKEPYRFQSEAVVHGDSLPIAIMYSVDWVKPDAGELLNHLERSLGGMVDALQIDDLPPTRIAFGYTLDERTFETARLEDEDGLLVRANYHGMSERQLGDLEAYLIREVFDHTTRGRSLFEPKRWLHDGFSRWWAKHGLEEPETPADPVLVARAAVALRYIDGLPEAIPRWDYLREILGEPLAEALAYCAVKALEEKAGRDAVLELARSILGRSPPDDMRETLYEWFHPMAKVFFDSTGERWDTFLADCEGWITDHARTDAVAVVLDEVPHLTGSVEVSAREGAIRRLAGRFASGGNDSAPRTQCVLLHRRLSAFDYGIHPKTLLREEMDCSESLPSIELIGRYGRGERVFVAMEFNSPALDAPVRIASRRMVIE